MIGKDLTEYDTQKKVLLCFEARLISSSCNLSVMNRKKMYFN